MNHVHVFCIVDAVLEHCGVCSGPWDGLAEQCVLPECGLIRCPGCIPVAGSEAMAKLKERTA